MPKFYFNTIGRASDKAPIEVEVDLPDIDAAKCEAARYIGRVICDQADQFWQNGDLFLAISDDKGLVLFTMEVIGHDAPALKMR